MSKFYIATCQAKELATEAKMAKEKAKELSNEVLLKKGKVLRLTFSELVRKTELSVARGSLKESKSKFGNVSLASARKSS